MAGPEIKRIDSDSVNRLCAGQGIIDLKGCVKELVDNSLDSGANIIKILLIDDGTTLVEVSDNGSGISSQDFEHICTRYNTSKIQKFDAINASLRSIGFRGEALSSLRSVSELSVTSRTINNEVGYRVEFYPGGCDKQVQRPVACEVGTTVSIKNLFFNFPVRQKAFRKTARSQVMQTTKLITAYALINSSVKFVLQSLSKIRKDLDQPRLLLASSGILCSLEESVRSLLGASCSKDLVPFNFSSLDVEPSSNLATQEKSSQNEWTLSGLLLPPMHCYRKQRKLQFLYVNRRPVDGQTGMRSIVLQLTNAYRVLASGKPVAQYVLCFDTTSDIVDFNVTPDKQSVFIKDEEYIGDAFYMFLIKRFESQVSTLSPHYPTDQQILVSPSQALVPLSINSLPCSLVPKSQCSTIDSESPTEQRKRSRMAFQFEKTMDHEPLPQHSHHKGLLNKIHEGELPLNKRICKEKNILERKIDSMIPTSVTQVDSCSTPSHCETLPTGIYQSKIGSSIQLGADNRRVVGEQDKHVNDVCTATTKSTKGAVAGLRNVQAVCRASNPSSHYTNNRNDSSACCTSERESFTLYEWKAEGISIEVDSETKQLQYVSESNMNIIDQTGPLPSFEHIKSTQAFAPSIDSSKYSQYLVMSKSHNMSSRVKTLDLSRPPLQEFHNISMTLSNVLNLGKISVPHQRYERALGCFLCSELTKCQQVPSVSKNFVSHVVERLDDDLAQIEDLDLEGELGLNSSPKNFGHPVDTSYPGGDVQFSPTSVTFPKALFKQIRIIGQFNLGFIIASLQVSASRQELFVIDQHAADEKSRFELLCNARKIQSQPLVIPIILELSPTERQMNGFPIEVNSDASTTSECLQLRGLPLLYKHTLSVDDMRDLIELISDGAGEAHLPLENASQEKREKDSVRVLRPPKIRSIMASWACRSAVMIGQSLTKLKMKKIIEQMSKLDHPWNCPHGRPTMRHLYSYHFPKE